MSPPGFPVCSSAALVWKGRAEEVTGRAIVVGRSLRSTGVGSMGAEE